MKVLTVPPELRQELSREPEYAMGYQIGRARIPSGQIVRGYILNSSIFVAVSDVRRADENTNAMYLLRLGFLGVTINLVRKSIPEGEKADVIELERRPLDSLKGVVTIKSAELRNFSARLEEALAGRTGAAKDAPITSTVAAEVFKRFSHFKDDFRVTSGLGLTKGTFATTAADALHVRTGMDAVHRYALPDKRPANQRFTISPPQGTQMQRGVAQPAYGEKGGGVEVIFVDGSPDKTVTGPEEIPER
jgi:hypothetical protein